MELRNRSNRASGITVQTPIRRMNRFQYNNAVKDLFQLSVETYPLPERMMRDLGNYFQPQSEKMPLEVKVTSRPLGKDQTTEPHLRGLTPFPQDLRAEHGFDNRADHLTLSPMLLESFMQLSRSIVESPDFNKKTCGIWPEFFADPSDNASEAIKSTIRNRLQAFLKRAFRRPSDENLVDRYVGLVLSQLASGASFEEARSILQLIDSDFSYRSDLLDAWYRDGSQGKPGAPTQVVLRRVPVTDRRQGGVITSAAVLTMTSGTTRTKPIARGAWLATVILNDPPSPPPGDVAPLADKPSAEEENMTLRERFVAHRRDHACAGCHQRIDPLGFALENFNAAGIWRDKYENGREIDASGKLFARHAFQDIVGFKDGLLAEKDRFTRAFAEHLLSFAIGRKISVADSSALNKIVSETAAADYRIRTRIEQVVLSDSFQR